MVPECKPEWNREAITVFSRVPSLRRLQATPPLQTSFYKGKLPKDSIILTFDQVVVCDGELREKPIDESEARKFLKSYSEGT